MRRIRRGKRRTRRPLPERLEPRLLLATWQNSFNRLDVNDDGLVSPIDALVNINHLNAHPGNPNLPAPPAAPPPFLDTSGDGLITPLDALIIINALNNPAPPRLDAQLVNDTAPRGMTNDDGITSDPRVVGRAVSPVGINELQLRIDQGEWLNVSRDADGRFAINPPWLRDGSNDGTHQIEIRATDGRRVTVQTTINVTLDTQPPLPAPTFQLDPNFDTEPVGDKETAERRVTLSGTTEAHADLDIMPSGLRSTADAAGEFQFRSLPLALGPNELTARAWDAAGNLSTFSDTIVRIADAESILVSEAGHWVSQATRSIELGQESGSRTLRLELETSFDTSDTNSAWEDRFSIFLVDPSDPTLNLLDAGPEHSALFSTSLSATEFAAGQVTFDGSILDIDLTSLNGLDQGLLVFQWLNLDLDDGSQAAVKILSNKVDPDGVQRARRELAGDALAPGPEIDLPDLAPLNNTSLEARQLHWDADQGLLSAELTVGNEGAAVSRQLAVSFPELPDGVSLLNASGTDATGHPYLNLAPAVPSGGLMHLGRTHAVEALFANPGQVRFALQPVVMGRDNRPPVLEPLAPIELMPGETGTFPISVTDADGDRVRLFLLSDGPLPTVSLRDDTLRVSPSPDQTGTYEFTLLADDGLKSSDQTVTIDVIQDPISTTRISGFVFNTLEEPLAGVPIELAGVETTTAADGSFELVVAATAGDQSLIIHGERWSGTQTYPYIAEKLPLLLGHELYAQVNNVVGRPIYLPPLDMDTAVVVDPSRDTIVHSAIPGLTLTVKAGTLLTENGDFYRGPLSVTEVPPDLTPAALPDNLAVDVVITVQPAGLVFTEPASLTFPNSSQAPAGTAVNLVAIDPVEGDFRVTGRGVVTADGSSISITEGGVVSSSWFAAPPVPPEPVPPDDNPRNPDDGCPACPVDGSDYASEVETHSGALRETHELVSYHALGQDRGLTLHYDSGRADPRPIVHFGFAGQAGFTTMAADITLATSGAVQSLSSARQQYWSLPAAADVETALQLDMRRFPSGVYDMTLRSGVGNFSADDATRFVGTLTTNPHRVVHVNLSDSPFGAGWSLSPWSQLVESDDGAVLIIDGQSGQLEFGPSETTGEFSAPAGDFSQLTRLPDGSYTRRFSDQSATRYDSAGRLTSVSDRLGNLTRYERNAEGQLLRIVDPVGLITQFEWTNGRVTSITDPAHRRTALHYDPAGNLIRIQDPDGAARVFTYDDLHHLRKETDARDHREEIIYGSHGRVVQVVRQDGATIDVDPLAVQGLAAPFAQVGNIVGHAMATSPPEVGVVDPNGNLEFHLLDRLGRATARRDALGDRTQTNYNAAHLLSETIDPRGHITRYRYDQRGNVISVDSGLGAVISGTIDSALTRHTYTFELTRPTPLYFDSLISDFSETYLEYEIRGPETYRDGTDYDHPVGWSGPLPAGQYVLSVYAYTGAEFSPTPYEFRLLDLNQSPRCETGQLINGSFALPGLVDTYQITLAAGEMIYGETILPGGRRDSVEWQLWSADGQLVFSTYWSWEEPFFSVPQSGTYHLIVADVSFSDATRPGPYAFRFISKAPASTVPITLNQRVESALSAPGDTGRYEFELATEELVYIDWFSQDPTDSGARQSFELSGPFQATAEPGFAWLEAGSYAFEVSHDRWAESRVLGDYGFAVRRAADAVTIPLDSKVTGTLFPIRESQLYKFTAAAGDQFNFRLLRDNNLQGVRWTLADPFGNTVFDQPIGNVNDRTLLFDGTYTLSVDGTQETGMRGVYDFEVRRLGNQPPQPPAGTPIVIGDTVSGNLADGSDRDVYVFYVPEATLLAFVNLNPDLEPFWFTQGPRPGSYNYQDVFFAEPGYHAIEISYFTAGDYSFKIMDFAQGASFQLGEAVSGELSPFAEPALFRFDGQAGQRILPEVVAQTNMDANQWRFFHPRGHELGSQAFVDATSDIRLPAPAAYRLMLESFNSPAHPDATFTFEIMPVGVSHEALQFGVRTTGTVAQRGDEAQYHFALDSPRRLLLDWSVAGDGLYWQLWRDEELVTGGATRGYAREFPQLAPGDYTLLVRDVAEASGTFAFEVVDLANTTPMPLGQPVQGNLIPRAGIVTYQFDAQQGERVYLDILDATDMSHAQWRVIGPHGQVGDTYYFGDEARIDLPHDGRYALVIDGFKGVVTDPDGAFTIQLNPVPTSDIIPLVPGQTVAGEIAGAGYDQVYALDVAQPASLYFDGLGAPPGLRWSLLAADGAMLVEHRPISDADLMQSPLEVGAGSYRLVVDAAEDAVGAYAFRLLDLRQAPVLGIGTTVDGTLEEPLGTDAFRFTAKAGDRFAFPVSDSLTADWRLLDPVGREIFAGPLQSQSATTLPLDGDYTLLIETRAEATELVFQTVPGENPILLAGTIDGERFTPQAEGVSDRTTLSGTLTLLLDHPRLPRSVEFQTSTLDAAVSGNWTPLENGGGSAGQTAPADFAFTHTTDVQPGIEGIIPVAIRDIIANVSSFTFIPLEANGELDPTWIDWRLSQGFADRHVVVPILGNAIFEPGRDDLKNRRLNYHGMERPTLLPGGEPNSWELSLPLDHQFRFFPLGSEVDLDVTGQVVATATMDVSYAFSRQAAGYEPPQPFPGIPLAVGQTVSGTLDESDEVDLYSLSLDAPVSVVLDLWEDEVYLQWSLVDRGGTVVQAAGGDAVSPLVTLEAGDYQLQIASLYGYAGDYQFRLLDTLAAPALQLVSPVSAALTPPDETDAYRLEAGAGDLLYFDILDDEAYLDAEVRWIDPLGQTYAQTGFSDTTLGPLPHHGTYTILLEGYLDSFAEESDYQFQLLPIDDRDAGPLTLDTTGVSFEYEPMYGRLIRQVDPTGRETRYQVDGLGNVVAATQTVGDLGGNDDLRVQYEYLPNGLLAAEKDHRGRETRYQYDNLGRLTRIRYRAGTPRETSERFEYDDAGNRIAHVDAAGVRRESQYDAMNRVLRIVASTYPDQPLTFSYDAAGNLVQQVDAEGGVTSHAYDVFDRRIQIVNPAGSATSLQYDRNGNLVAVTDALGNSTQRRFDARNRVTRTVDANGADVELFYDAAGNVVRVEDGLGQWTDFVFDQRGRLVHEVDQSGLDRRLKYDAADRVTFTSDATGRAIRYRYDALNRLTDETWLDPSGQPANELRFTYDRSGNILTAVDDHSSLQFSYDEDDRIVGTTRTLSDGGPEITLNYSYDALGRRLTRTDRVDSIAAAQVAYQYDALGRLVTLSETGPQAGDKRVELAYDARDQVVFVSRFGTLAGGTSAADTRYAYDAAGRLLNVRHENAAGTISEFSYRFDAAGRIDQIVDSAGTAAYQYDDRNQLVAVQYQGGGRSDEFYAYDDNGNRLASHFQAALDVGSNDRLLDDGTYAYEYDGAGNPIRRRHVASGAVRQWEWDHRQRLTRVVDRNAAGTATQVAAYRYDVFDRRISKAVDTSPQDAVDAALRHYVYDGQGIALEFVDADGAAGPVTPDFDRRHLQGLLIDQVFAEEPAQGDVAWLLTDHLGTVRDVVSGAGLLINHIEYDAYGQVLSQTDPAAAPRFLFTARELDEETGQYFYRSRYYDPALGRFLSRDPLGMNGGETNPYSYVQNNPVNWSDPGGMLSGAQCDTVRELLRYEAEHGTLATAWRVSNTLSGGTPHALGSLFDNGAVETVAGVIDLDWYTDLIAFSGGTATLGSIGPFNLGGAAAFFTYGVGKGVWNVARKLGDSNTNVAWWFQDPKEVVAFKSLAAGLSSYADLFPPYFMEAKCGSTENDDEPQGCEGSGKSSS